ncbi:MAG: zinc-binding alcohol dehydrogenase [Methylobacteriaceae bacterium]|nr:zinc-binding alcohol dehydrogenase [Methylobacteriaceae bacterium]
MRSPSSNRPTEKETARALWYSGLERAEIREEPLPELQPGEAQVRVLYSAISRGTERLVFSGSVSPSEHERMRAPLMAGVFPFPVKYGYAVVGRVEQGPPEWEGRLVFALHPHQSVLTLPADALVPVPDGVPPARAVLAANMETALNAMWDAAPGPADRIAIVGAGVVGALVAWLCGRLPGTQVTLVDIAPSRTDLAHVLGVRFAGPDAAPQDCDLVVHASGTAAGLATALSSAGNEATVLEMSWYGAGEVAAPLGGAFHSRRLKLISSQVGQVAPSHRARWTHSRRLAAALDLLAEPALDVLIAPAIAFHELPARLPDILGPKSGALCQLVKYPAAE